MSFLPLLLIEFTFLSPTFFVLAQYSEQHSLYESYSWTRTTTWFSINNYDSDRESVKKQVFERILNNTNMT